MHKPSLLAKQQEKKIILCDFLTKFTLAPLNNVTYFEIQRACHTQATTKNHVT
jgi:hypothetical protein